MTKSKTWIEKMGKPQLPEIKQIQKAFSDIPEGALIPTPRIIEDYINQTARGSKIDIKTMRQDLALGNGAEYSCPLTTGIFLRIVAEANYERYLLGEPIDAIAPFWRVIDPKAPLAKKLSFGKEFLLERRSQEERQLI